MVQHVLDGDPQALQPRGAQRPVLQELERGVHGFRAHLQQLARGDAPDQRAERADGLRRGRIGGDHSKSNPMCTHRESALEGHRPARASDK